MINERFNVYSVVRGNNRVEFVKAQLLTESAGGKVVLFATGKRIDYNQKEDILNSNFIDYAPH